jgi:hypothetical protein
MSMIPVFPRLNAVVRQLLGMALALGLASAAFGQSDPQEIPSTPSNLTSTAERMISYRHQNHMWQTSDGVTHTLVNVGVQPSGASLRLHTSVDNGLTWSGGPELPLTDDTSTSDGFLVNNSLFVSYSTAAGGVAFSQLNYEPDTRTWVLGATEVAFQSPDIRAINPTVARDALGRHWVAFTSQDSDGYFKIKLVRRGTGTQGWVDSGYGFGGSDNLSIERSARVVTIAGGMGMIYTVHQDVFWATRQDAWPASQNWKRQQVYVDKAYDNDPFGSHFSVTVDDQNNVHIAMVDGGKIVYQRLSSASQTWSRQVLTKAIRAAYVQILAAGNTLMLVGNDRSVLSVFQSTDGGTTWAKTHVLTHPVSSGTIDYSNPRVELPGNNAVSPVPVLQQYSDGSTQRTLSFQVPLATAP